MFRPFLPATIWAGIILFLTLMPGNYLPKVDYWSLLSVDKYIHFTFFFVQVYLLLMGEWKRKISLTLSQYVTPFLAGTIFGVLIEFIQIVIPHRSFDVEDMVANTIGAFLGAIVFRLLHKEKKKSI